MIEHINSGNEAAGIINQGNDIDPVFFSVRIRKAGIDAAVPAPDLIDMRAFISAHILVPVSYTHLDVYKRQIVLIQTHAKTSKGIPTKMEMKPSSG